MRTEKLYETDGHLRTFSATVIASLAVDGEYEIELDRTAFFPEGGGQGSDRGTLGGANVTSVREKNGTVLHKTDRPLAIGSFVTGTIDYDLRFRRMQNHTGEHIVSGIIHRRFGFDNVGFHLGDADVTLDISGELTAEALYEVETEANRIVFENRAVTVSYPTPEELPTLEYRSKLALTEGVRLVTVEGCDVCACCAPHVARTGEIGMIRFLSFARYKGGIRLHILAGFSALEDYRERCRAGEKISRLLSVPQESVSEGVQRLFDAKNALARQNGELARELYALLSASLPETEGNRCLFRSEPDSGRLREFAKLAIPHAKGVTAVFSGDGQGPFRYVIGSETVDLKAAAREINAAIGGRGGGSAKMMEGSASADRETIENFFAQHRFL